MRNAGSLASSARPMVAIALVAIGFLAAIPGIGSADTLPPAGGDLSAASVPPSVVGVGVLPNDLSPWGMFLNADIVVKVVIVGLAFASVVTWTIWLAKSLEIFAARRRLDQAFGVVGGARSLAAATEQLGDGDGVARSLLRAATDEWRLSVDALADRDGLKERIGSHLERIEAATGRRMTRGTGVLATIGATAPFVGLFGTVWGIMNSFVGISQSHTTNLAVVAPGIAEALLATACGLVAAIPAVVIYNHFARQVAAYKALAGDTAAAVLRLVSRDLSRGEPGDASETDDTGPLRALAE
jgi:biopolymer transport protein ExbB